MEPIRETREAIDDLDPIDERVDDLLGDLTTLANRSKEVIPELVGVSVCRVDQDLTFTLVASSEEIAILDAVQYLAGGPCVVGADVSEVMQFNSDELFDEDDWQLFAETTSARSIHSTLTLPVVGHDEEVVGTINFYADSHNAFEGHHEELAEIFGAWAAGAVTNADLSFLTRRRAEAAPGQVHEHNLVQTAIGHVAGHLRIDVEAAEAALHEAALRAGISVDQLAHDIVITRRRPDLG